MVKFLPDWLPPQSGAYLVGGCVRDLLLDREPTDYDIAFLGPPAAYAKRVASALGGRVVEIGKPAFRIWRVVARGRFVDVAPAAGRSIADDLRQRDFTVNAMAVDIATATLIDVAGSRRDLDRGVIRMVSPAAFEQDPVRLLRAFRLAAQLGFAIDAKTSAAIQAGRALIHRSAGERMRVELFKLLAAPRAHPHVCAMAQAGLLAVVLPELDQLNDEALARRMRNHGNLEALLSDLASYFPSCAQGIDGCLTEDRRVLLKIAAWVPPGVSASSIPPRLRFSNRDASHLDCLIQHYPLTLAFIEAGEDSPRDRMRFFRTTRDALPDLLLLAAADAGFPGEAPQALRTRAAGLLAAYFAEYRPRAAAAALLSGDDLIRALGLSPSPLFKVILEFVEEERLVRPNMSRSEALETARQCLKHVQARTRH
jgi:tRNA nucleotidyltransferase/poly(A) polymerase